MRRTIGDLQGGEDLYTSAGIRVGQVLNATPDQLIIDVDGGRKPYILKRGYMKPESGSLHLPRALAAALGPDRAHLFLNPHRHGRTV